MTAARRLAALPAYGLGAVLTLGICLTGLYSYLLFHSLVEIVTIAIALTLLVLAWNTRAYIADGYIRLLGFGYGFVALLDLLHALAYAGMGVFRDGGGNLPTQLWIAARYLQAAALLAAPLLAPRRVDDRAVAATFAVAVAALAAAVFAGAFPACYVDGAGLTPFKVGSEYAIVALLILALLILVRRKGGFAGPVRALLVASIACTIASELCFTAYASVYGPANLAGHVAKLWAFYLVYRAIVRTGLREPYGLIFEEMRRSEAALRAARDTMEERVALRTAELAASEARYRRLLRNVRAAVVVHGADTRIRMANPMAQEVLGLSADQLLGRAAADPRWSFLREDGSIMPPAEYPVARTLASGAPLEDAVVGVRRPDRDAAVWALVNTAVARDGAGAVEEVVVTFVDVTDRMRAEEALKKSETLLNAAQRLAGVGGWEYDVRSGRTTWTAELYRLHGLPPDPGVDHLRASLACYRPEDRPVICEAFRRACERGEAYDLEFPFTSRAGRALWVRATAQPVFEGNAVARVVGNLMDITDRKAAEEGVRRLNEGLEDRVEARTAALRRKSAELRENQVALMNIVEDLNEKTAELERANAKVRELDRLKSMFIASMSHELRTPLNSIIGFSSILLDGWAGALAPEQAQDLGIVLRAGRHLLSLVNDVIDVSKIEAGMIGSAAEDFDLLDAVMEAVDAVRPDAERKGLELLLRVPRAPLRADRRRFLQCVINLLGNAAKYTDRGSITVGAEVDGDGPGLVVWVEDTGIGIKEEDLGRLFAPFVRLGGALGNSIPGTGLGLYLTKKLVTETMGGELLVASAYGVGSRFSIRLPRPRS